MAGLSPARVLAEAALPGLRWRRERVFREGWRQVGPAAPDPGNRGQVLTLWEHPQLPGHGRLLVCVDGTTGTAHDVRVPPFLADPLVAVAWSYSRRPGAYAPVRRT